MKVWPVFHEWTEDREYILDYKSELVSVYSTEELAKAAVTRANIPYDEDDHCTFGGFIEVIEE